MADQKINALPTKTSPTTGDKVLMSGAAEEYLIDYDQLATAILNKLTSKTYTLDQGTKTLVAALNELNSKMLKDSMGTNLKSFYRTVSTDFSQGISDIDISDIMTTLGISTIHFVFSQLRNDEASTFATILKTSFNQDEKTVRVIVGNPVTETWYTGGASIGVLVIGR